MFNFPKDKVNSAAAVPLNLEAKNTFLPFNKERKSFRGFNGKFAGSTRSHPESYSELLA